MGCAIFMSVFFIAATVFCAVKNTNLNVTNAEPVFLATYPPKVIMQTL